MRAVPPHAKGTAELTERMAHGGTLRATPFADLLVALLDLRKTGTLRVATSSAEVQALVRFEGGVPVAARVQRLEANLIQSLIPLCACADGEYRFDDDRDDVGDGSAVVKGKVDPLALIAAVFRGPAREDAVNEVLGSVGPSLLKLHPRMQFERYRFTQQEQQVVTLLQREPMSLAELESYLPARVARRVVYVLKVTRGVSLLPAQRRAVSGTVEHASSLPEAEDVMDEIEVEISQAPAPVIAPVLRPSFPTMIGQPAPGRYHLREPQAAAPEQPLVVFEQAALPPALQLWANEIRARAAQIKRQDHYAALGVQRGCSEQELSLAFAQQSMRFAPESLPDALAGLRARATRIFARLSEAHQTLADPERRAHYDQTQAASHKLQPQPPGAVALESDSCHREAERLLRLSDYPGALAHAQRALRAERSARNEALYAWLLALCGSGPGAVHPRAVAHIDAALRREPQAVAAHYYRALILKRAGQHEEARLQWKRVLKLSPDHAEAARELRVLEMRRRPRTSSGLIGRLFGDKDKSGE